MARTVGFGDAITVTVATAGTPVPISTSTKLTPEFEVSVPSTNTGSVYVGNSNVENASGAVPAIARSTSTITTFVSGTGSINKELLFDLSKIYINADNNGDIARVQYVKFED